LNDVDLCLRKELLRSRIEEHQAEVERVKHFRRPFDYAHLAAQLREVHAGRVGQQIAADLAEQVFNQGKAEVAQSGAVVDAVVERSRGGDCQTEELAALVHLKAGDSAVAFTLFGCGGSGYRLLRQTS